MTSEEIVEKTKSVLMNTYNRLPLALAKGKGSYLWDVDGKKYLDFFSGLAVTNLGHCPPRVLYAVSKQARTLLHVSNLFYTEPAVHVADLLVKHSFGDKVFFCNSGAEANEGAVKLARKYSKKVFGESRYEIITMKMSFHGRTLGMITATGQEKFQKGFEPLLPGFRYAEFGNLSSVEDAVTDHTCAILVEPIQGEGGVRMAGADFFKGLRSLCHEKGLLLIYDEVQTGMGRTGRLFGYENFGVEPDIMTLAKALASGFPVGALVARDFVAEAFQPGDHASTFGANPLVMAAARATIETILKDGLLENARETGSYLIKQIEKLRKSKPSILSVRGQGLMIGMDITGLARPVVLKCIEKGLLINAVQEKTLRLLPPLSVQRKHVDRAVDILSEVL